MRSSPDAEWCEGSFEQDGRAFDCTRERFHEGFHDSPLAQEFRMADKVKDIPANTNSIENGLTDPTPEKGKGGPWRAFISWLKGWRS